MTSRKRKLTDDEIEAEVLADLNDPAAWDEPICVPPSKSPRPAWVAMGRHLEISARFHVMSVLHRLGVEASLTNANPQNVDIAVVQAAGRAITIDVKTLVGRTNWQVSPFTAREHHYLAFVLFGRGAAEEPATPPDVLIFPSTRLQALLEQQRTDAVDIRKAARELGITDPWREIVADAA